MAQLLPPFPNRMSMMLAEYNHPFDLLKSCWLNTPLGSMLSISDEDALYLLDFVDRRSLERNIARLVSTTKSNIAPGKTKPLLSIEKEITSYFKGELHLFETPIYSVGSPFQKSVWNALVRIPYGETRSYAEQAISIGKPSAYRAVANANGANQLAIVIPCHRIINSSGMLGGYGGGLSRKAWLLHHEDKNKEIPKKNR